MDSFPISSSASSPAPFLFPISLPLFPFTKRLEPNRPVLLAGCYLPLRERSTGYKCCPSLSPPPPITHQVERGSVKLIDKFLLLACLPALKRSYPAWKGTSKLGLYLTYSPRRILSTSVCDDVSCAVPFPLLPPECTVSSRAWQCHFITLPKGGR